MPIQYTCVCGTALRFLHRNAGQDFTCPKCGREFAVPMTVSEVQDYVDAEARAGPPGRMSQQTEPKAIRGILLDALRYIFLVFIALQVGGLLSSWLVLVGKFVWYLRSLFLHFIR